MRMTLFVGVAGCCVLLGCHDSVPDLSGTYTVFVGACAYRLNGGGDAANLAGTYFTHSCDNGSTGTFSLKRQ